MNDQMAAPVRELIALYREKYSQIRFPGLDLSVLELAAEAVANAQVKLAAAEASIEPLRTQMKTIEGELAQKVARALAFLKVHVEGDEAEYAHLDALTQALLSRRSSRKPADAAAAAGAERVRRVRVPKANARAAMDVLEVAVDPGDLAEADLPSSALSAFDRVAE
jgi:hypothetical protein